MTRPGHIERALLLALAALGGCGDDAILPEPTLCETKLSLIDASAWTQIPAESDPFAPAQDPFGKGPCPPEEVVIEELGGVLTVSVYTRTCSWATVEQPSLVDVVAGEPLTIRIWRFSQTLAWVPEGLNVVAVGEERMWEETTPLPAGSDILMGRIEAPFDIASGAPIRWHLSNHGDNSWNFVELSVTREVPCDTLPE